MIGLQCPGAWAYRAKARRHNRRPATPRPAWRRREAEDQPVQAGLKVGLNLPADRVGSPAMNSRRSCSLGSGLGRPASDGPSRRWSASSAVGEISSIPRRVLAISHGSRPSYAAVLGQDRQLVADHVKRAEDVAGVGVLGRQPQRPPLAPPADQDLRAARLERARVVQGVADAVMPSGHCCPLLGEHRPADPERVLQPRQSLARCRPGVAVARASSSYQAAPIPGSPGPRR